MAGFSQDFIESVRNAGDIVRLISDYVPLKQSGSRLKGLCPFHEEKTPSFSVDPGRQLFYCFGCQTGGDVFKFVMLYEKVTFPEAAEILARRWGVPLPAPTRSKDGDRVERLLEMNRTAEAYFRSRLQDGTVGSPCRDYLRKRRIDDQTAERLGVGFAPDAWDGLRGHLLARRFKPEEYVLAGLGLPRKSGSGEYDRFRNRLMFPIHAVDGRPVAFGGRALGDAEPKYINSPETPAYKKGQHLYGLNLAREAIRREGFAVVVEGYLDLAAVLQSGVDQVVASLGTAFTEAQARLLARYTNRVVFSYDGDSAGAAATARSLDLLLTKGFEVRVVELPGGSDPDDFISREGAEAYGRLLREAPDYLDFLIQRESRTRDLQRIEERVAAVNAVLPHLAKLSGAVERATWSSRLADALHIEDEWVLQELRSAVRGSRTGIRQEPAIARAPRPAEALLVTQLLRSRRDCERLGGELDPADLEGTDVRPIVDAILSLTKQGKRVDCPAVLDVLQDEADRDLLTRIAFQGEPEDGPGVDDCLCAFRRERLVREGRQVRREIGELQQQPSGHTTPAEVDRQLMRLQELARQRDALS